MRNSLSLIAVAVALFVVAGCGAPPFPKDKLSYIGTWSFTAKNNVESVSLNIDSDGNVQDQEIASDGNELDRSGPISDWKGDDFVVFFHQYQVTKTPRAVPSTCTDDLGCNFGDTCGDGACK